MEKDWDKINNKKNNTILLNMAINNVMGSWDVKALVDKEGQQEFASAVMGTFKIYKRIHSIAKEKGYLDD